MTDGNPSPRVRTRRNPNARALTAQDQPAPEPEDDGGFIKRGDSFEFAGWDVHSISEKAKGLARNNRGTPIDIEYCFRMVNRLMLQGIDTFTIARTFDVSIATAYKWIDQVKQRRVVELLNIDRVSIVAESVNFYNFLRDAAVSQYMREGNSTTNRLRALELAGRMAERRDRFLIDAGAFNNFKLELEEMNEKSVGKDDAEHIQEMTEFFFKGLDAELSGQVVDQDYFVEDQEIEVLSKRDKRTYL